MHGREAGAGARSFAGRQGGTRWDVARRAGTQPVHVSHGSAGTGTGLERHAVAERSGRSVVANVSMTDAGRRVGGCRQADGSWNALDAIEEPHIPDDVAQALAACPRRRRISPPSRRPGWRDVSDVSGPAHSCPLWTTSTGQLACVATCVLTEPSRSPAIRPRPRLPITTSSACSTRRTTRRWAVHRHWLTAAGRRIPDRCAPRRAHTGRPAARLARVASDELRALLQPLPEVDRAADHGGLVAGQIGDCLHRLRLHPHVQAPSASLRCALRLPAWRRTCSHGQQESQSFENGCLADARLAEQYQRSRFCGNAQLHQSTGRGGVWGGDAWCRRIEESIVTQGERYFVGTGP